ncbi:MAG: family 10 glycosylhydrolase [Bacilli bacterium]|nr:family 10 glycosylhydrolase [Bacilli bacterium]
MKKVFFIIILLICIIVMNRAQELEETKGVYISYIELSRYLKDVSETKSKENIRQMILNAKELGVNTIILHVRPSMDAIYPSSVFPMSKYLSEEGDYPYDVLSYFIEEAHKKNIKLFAWVNPYRILTQGTKDDIPKDSPVYLKKETRLVVEANGVFLNPALEEANELILEGIDEILEYPVDGVLMDDYFYPGEDVDLLEYQEYIDTHAPISKQDFHIKNINKMVKEVHSHCQKKQVLFGISPEGNIENNYLKNAADVGKWLREDGYVDFIMPQLYYGFENETKPFIQTLKEWQEMNIRSVPLIPVLAFYKVGKEDIYAKNGKDEWMKQDNIIQKEIIHLKNQRDYQGFILYRYDNIWNEEEFTKTSKQEINHLKKILK